MMVHHLARHVARKHAMHFHVNARMNLPISRERRQQRVDRAFVHAERNLAALEAAQLLHALANFFAQIQHPVRVFNEQRARVRQRLRARASNE